MKSVILILLFFNLFHVVSQEQYKKYDNIVLLYNKDTLYKGVSYIKQKGDSIFIYAGNTLIIKDLNDKKSYLKLSQYKIYYKSKKLKLYSY